MSQKIQLTSPRRLGTSTRIAVFAAAIFAIAPTWAMASDAAKPGAAPMASMDHSKMQGMKHEDCSKHMEGMSMTGDINVDFAKNMRMHHQMAVTMARAQIKDSKDAQLIKLSRSIITAQNKEIATLDAWLNANKQRASKPVANSR